ncbi:MAG: sigma-70 family RNA polymerase sigma factor [Tyzzerella sp.]|nr:sigma-70 family RNA polymerase sigma factor [Tyzzerella sp.]
MEYNLKTAVEQMKNHEEAGMNYIYSKTYNYVYLRAKSILRRESDVQQLLREVYLKMLDSATEIEVDNLYEWLGKCAYTMGCGYYRKKKAREAENLEIDKSELLQGKIINVEDTTEVIEKSLEELPDLYQATFYAFYYDYMSVDEIAKVMDCSTGIILNRLNYTRKYMIKALENYHEETKVKVSFTVEAVCTALRKWSVDHCLGMTTAQTVYGDICKSVNMQSTAIYLEGKEFAGVNNTVVYHKPDDLEPLQEQFELYGKKTGVDKKIIGIVAGVVIVVAAVVLACILLLGSGDDKKEKSELPNKVEEQQEEPKAEPQEEEQVQEEQEPVFDTQDYIFPDSATRKLTLDEIKGHTKEELRLGRNEIYARHGMIFGVEDLDQYFLSKSWYTPSVPGEEFYDRVEMSLIEEENVSLIRQVESQM